MAEPSPCRPASMLRETGQCILIKAALHGGRNFNWDIGVDTLNKWGDLAVKRTLPTLIGFLTPQTTPSPLQLARVSDSPPDDGISPWRVHISQDWFSYLCCHSGMTCAAHKHIPSSRQLADPWFWRATKTPHVYVENRRLPVWKQLFLGHWHVLGVEILSKMKRSKSKNLISPQCFWMRHLLKIWQIDTQSLT